MAIANTLTASLHNIGVKYLPSGAYVVSSRYARAATTTPSSYVLLAKVPNGAVIHDFTLYTDQSAADGQVKIGLMLPEGLSGSWTYTESALLTETTTTLGPTLKPITGVVPLKVSFTDTERFAWIIAVNVVGTGKSSIWAFTALLSNDQGNI